MLVLTRQKNDSLVIDKDIVLTVIDVIGGKVRIGIEAPREVVVLRREILDSWDIEHRDGAVWLVGRPGHKIGPYVSEAEAKVIRFGA